MSDDPNRDADDLGHAEAHHGPLPGEKPRWLDDCRNVDKLLYALYAACAFLFLIDVFIPKHGPFDIEYMFGFYGIFGFAGCVVLVIAAKALRNVLMRPEDYYER